MNGVPGAEKEVRRLLRPHGPSVRDIYLRCVSFRVRRVCCVWGWRVIARLGMSYQADGTTDGCDFWILLHGSDAPRARTSLPRPKPTRVVLLHGWLQTHTCWLPVATALRDRYGHDVLLLDFYGHGLTGVPSAEAMSLEGFTALVASRIAAIGWDEGEPLSLAGCSLGAATAARYAASRPERVARLTLVTPPGLPEPWYMPCHPVRELAKAICSVASDDLRLIDLLRVIRTTPGYGVPVARLLALVERGALRLTVYVAQRDVVHSPHEAFWRAAEARCNAGGYGAAASSGDATPREPARCSPRAEDMRMRVVFLPGATHWGVCHRLDKLGLEAEEALWHAPCELSESDRQARATDAVVRARL